jgi:hypothetical protein
MDTKRLKRSAAVILVMLIGGLLGSAVATLVSAIISHCPLNGDGGLFYIYYGKCFLVFSPSLLLLYLAIFVWRRTNAVASLFKAALCAFFYSPMLMIMFGALHSEYSIMKNWGTNSALALIPGVIVTLIALLATVLSQSRTRES